MTIEVLIAGLRPNQAVRRATLNRQLEAVKSNHKKELAAFTNLQKSIIILKLHHLKVKNILKGLKYALYTSFLKM